MKRLAYRTWRRSITWGAGLLALSFAAPILIPSPRWAWVFDWLFWVSIVAISGFHLGVALLRKIGLVEFSFTNADRNSYLYNLPTLQNRMKQFRGTKKSD